MFIEQLNEEQVKDFLNKHYGADYFTEDYFKHEIRYSKKRKKIYVSIRLCNGHDDGDTEYDYLCLWDFGAETERCYFKIKVKWIKYLYKLFGEEYKQAYLAYHTEIFK